MRRFTNCLKKYDFESYCKFKISNPHNKMSEMHKILQSFAADNIFSGISFLTKKPCKIAFIGESLQTFLERLQEVSFEDLTLDAFSPIQFPTKFCANLQQIRNEDDIKLEQNKYDLVVLNGLTHYMDDPMQLMKNIYASLKPGGNIIGCVFGPEGASKINHSIRLASLERKGGFSTLCDSAIYIADLCCMLESIGFDAITANSQEFIFKLPSFYHLLYQLKQQGEGNYCIEKNPLSAQEIMAASAIYKQLKVEVENTNAIKIEQLIGDYEFLLAKGQQITELDRIISENKLGPSDIVNYSLEMSQFIAWKEQTSLANEKESIRKQHRKHTASMTGMFDMDKNSVSKLKKQYSDIVVGTITEDGIKVY